MIENTDEWKRAVRVFELIDEGLNPTAISRQMEREGWGPFSESVARNWKKNDDQFRPLLDEVALARALACDAQTISRLTPWERKEFYLRLPQQDWWEERTLGTEGNQYHEPVPVYPMWAELSRTLRHTIQRGVVDMALGRTRPSGRKQKAAA